LRVPINRTDVGSRVSREISDSDFAQNYGLYLRADIGFTPALWTDQSSNGRNPAQATSIKRPIAAIDSNGFDVVRFDGGINNFMALNDSTVCSEYTVMICFAFNNTQTSNIANIYGNRPWGNGFAQTVSLFGLDADFKPLVFQNSTSPQSDFFALYDDALIIDQINIITVIVKNNHRYLYVNGYLIKADLMPQTNLSTRIFSAWIGSEEDSVNFGGDIYRIAVWPSALSSEQRQNSEAVLFLPPKIKRNDVGESN